ncbi:glycoside hydrolase, partial [Tothia fuscella]
QGDIALYTRLVDLKQKDSSLKVFIAIGGWAFNDPGPTRTTFSDIAASWVKQRLFFKSLNSFLATYDFDGVDIDWEYPEADNRGGRSIDFKNFVTFISNLRQALDGNGGRNGLSITLPASLWYLQHFDIVSLSEHVDFFNIMSYDMHGTWDKGNKWTGNFLNAHTNMTEITDSFDLLWRNKIDPKKVVMGVGFYGRAFTISDKSCNTPGCQFSSGSRKGRCSGESGILMNSEIDEIVGDKHLTPKLYKDEAVKVTSWDDQWVAYDDTETFQLKADFARGQCLSGLMIWAVSHDTQDAKYSIALAKAANRNNIVLPSLGDKVYTEQKVERLQCKWTNCGDNNYIAIERSDKGATDKKGVHELMLDKTGCGKAGVRTWCCPTKEGLPICGW